MQIAKERLPQGYRMIGAYDEEQEKCIGAAGFWIGTRFYCGKFIQLDNMMVLPELRSRKLGRQMVEFVKEIGRAEGCSRILVDTLVENHAAHRFFLREGFIIRGYHLNCEL